MKFYNHLASLSLKIYKKISITQSEFKFVDAYKKACNTTA